MATAGKNSIDDVIAAVSGSLPKEDGLNQPLSALAIQQEEKLHHHTTSIVNESENNDNNTDDITTATNSDLIKKNQNAINKKLNTRTLRTQNYTKLQDKKSISTKKRKANNNSKLNVLTLVSSADEQHISAIKTNLNTEDKSNTSVTSSTSEKSNDTSIQNDETMQKYENSTEKDFKEKLHTIMGLAAKFCDKVNNSNTQNSDNMKNGVNSDNSDHFYKNPNLNLIPSNYQIQEAAIKILSNPPLNSLSSNLENNLSGLNLALAIKLESGVAADNSNDKNDNGITTTTTTTNNNNNSNNNNTKIDTAANNIGPNNFIMDLSSNSNHNFSSSSSAPAPASAIGVGIGITQSLTPLNTLSNNHIESHIVPVDPSMISTNLSSIEPNPVSTKRRKRSNWNVETERTFVKYWRLYYTELKKSKRTSVVYQKIADELNKFGLSLTCRDIQVKTHNMTQKYRHERRLIYSSGGKPSFWPVYDEVHDLIGHLYKDDAKPETSKEELIQSNDCLPGPSSPKIPKLESCIPQLDTLGSLGQFGALSQFGPLGQFATFNHHLGSLGTYDNLQIRMDMDEEEEYVMDNDINQPSVQDNLTTPSDYASESPSPSPISNNAVNFSSNGFGNPSTSRNPELIGNFNTITGGMVGKNELSSPNDGVDSSVNDKCNIVKKKKRNFNVEILTEIKKLNKDAKEDSDNSNKLLIEANEIEQKKLSIIEEYVRRSLQIQEKMLEIQIQRRNFN